MLQNNLKGGKRLRKNMPRGGVSRIAEIFKITVSYAGRLIVGKDSGNPLVIACAHELNEAWKESGYEKKENEILKKYERLNKARKKNRACNSK